jgi:U3 small nucleolar RNA-associated protein 25
LVPEVRPYTALLRSLTVDSAPTAKKRKLDKASGQEMQNPFEDDAAVDTSDIDRVEEVEEGPEADVEDILDEDDEDDEDPFGVHFADPEENVLSQRLKAIQKNQWSSFRAVVPKLGKAILSTPGTSQSVGTWVPPVITGLNSLKLKQKLAATMSKQELTFNPLELRLAPLIFNYQDVLYCDTTPANSESLRRLTCLHAINHVFKYADNLTILLTFG